VGVDVQGKSDIIMEQTLLCHLHINVLLQDDETKDVSDCRGGAQGIRCISAGWSMTG